MPVFITQKQLDNKIKSEVKSILKESSTKNQLDLFSLANTPYLDVVRNLTGSRYSYDHNGITTAVKNSMVKDAIISRVINMWISDTLQEDVLTKDVYQVEVEALDQEDKLADKKIVDIKDCIDYFRSNSNLDRILGDILYQVIVYGNSTVKLGFVDQYEETKIKLFESAKQKILNETESLDSKQLLEKLNESFDTDLLDDTKKRKKKTIKLSGKWFVEILPHRLVSLENKGIVVLYLDLDNPNKVLNPKNITNFTNRRGNVKTLSVKTDSTDIASDVYTLPIGESFIDNAVLPWSMLQSVEDCTMLALLTRSAIYRLFQVDVGAMSTKETEKFIQDFKKRLQTRESIDIREQYYSSVNTTLPLGDSIIIPTRNGIGTVNLQTIGNDLSIDTENPLKYFRQQLLAALGVPEGLIYGDTGNGGLINTSATKQDIRYLRTIQQFTSILKQGLTDIYKDYLEMLGIDTSKYAIYINFAQINSEQDLNRIEYEQTKLDALDRLMQSLNNIGITFEDGRYSETRDLIITRYLDSELLDTIKSDEKKQPLTQPKEPQEKSDKHLGGGFHPSSSSPDIDIDIDNTEPESNSEELSDEDFENTSDNPMLDLDDMSTLEEPVDQSEV